MRPFRFVHIADVHLDSPFRTRDEALRRRLREDLRGAFRRVVELALAEKVDGLLIAGDLFDNDRLAFATETFLVEQMARLGAAGIQVFYATGNHDPGRANYRAHQISWPDNVRVFRSGNPETVDVNDPEGRLIGRVTGAGHVTAAESDNLAARFPRVGQGTAHVALLHCWVTGARAEAAAHEGYAPCGTADLRDKGYGYWALGHIHARQEVLEENRAFYPGNLLGRHPRETGSKGALLVELELDGGVRAEFKPVSPVRWEQLTLDNLAAVGDLAGLRRAIGNSLRDLQGQNHEGDWLVRVNLTGPCPLYRELEERENLEFLESELAGEAGLLELEVRTGGLLAPVNPADYRQGPHLLASLLELIAAARGDGALLAELGPEPLAGLELADQDRRSYLAELLAGLEETAISRLIKEAGEKKR